jgi:beta-galactosidase
MTLTPFTDDWTFARPGEDPIAVTLPHDAMIGETRSRTAPSGSHGAYFPGGQYTYTKTWRPSADGSVELLFEGVYGDTRVLVDGREVATSRSGYREFAAPLGDLAAGRPVRIEVEVDNSRLPNSRWYTGSGIYRRVWLDDAPPTRIVRDGTGLRTMLSTGSARVTVEVAVANPDGRILSVDVDLEGPDGRRFTAEAEVAGESAVLELEIADPQLWSGLTPHLHRATVSLREGGTLLDATEFLTGLRTIEVDAARGLRINGNEVLLRGACVHHDSGPLGAATFRASEFRRARILKEAGFNAVRSSHNPLSRDFLDACDEVGLYVLDELTDVWFQPKTAHDVAPLFDELWRDDARSMVAKDRRHPSVIMYSIGNEIAESGSERGIAATREISDFLHALDPDRPTTFALNFLLNVMASSGRSPFNTSEHDAEKAEKRPSAVTSTVANVLANRIGGMMQTISKLPKADKVSRDTFRGVDVAGYNYAHGRYRGDARRYPDRVVLGTESMPGDIPKIWPLVESLPNLIGDFAWTGWDYLGETGIGSWAYGAETASISKPFPELVAGCGLIDITGRPDAALLLSRATWGLLDAPQIAVRPLDRAGEKTRRMAWRSTDAVQSWAWAGCEGRTAEVEVYSSDDEVELVLNGRSLGRKAAGRREGFVTRFRVPYAPGELIAIGYRTGVESGRSALRSAGPVAVTVRAESRDMAADGQDLAFVWIELADEHGVVEMLDDDRVTVEVSGAGRLAALASAVTVTAESFVDDEHTTWRGRALAVVRSSGEAGEVQVTVTSDRHGSTELTISARRVTTRPGLPSPV